MRPQAAAPFEDKTAEMPAQKRPRHASPSPCTWKRPDDVSIDPSIVELTPSVPMPMSIEWFRLAVRRATPPYWYVAWNLPKVSRLRSLADPLKLSWLPVTENFPSTENKGSFF